jgi:hypothetical protein
MKNSTHPDKPRNLALITIASVLITIGLAIVYVGFTNIDALGWWTVLTVLSGLVITGAAVTSIVRNDPSWILLELLLPV